MTAVSSPAPLEKDEAARSSTQHFSIRTERYRYILYRNGEEELYDHQIDAHEWTNLANDPKYGAIKDQMNSYAKKAKKDE